MSNDITRSFTCFYHNYREKVRQLVSRYCFNDSLEEDLVQEVFLRLWRKRDQLNGVDNPDAWIVAFTRNVVMDHLRKQRREQIAWTAYCATFRNFYSCGHEFLDNKYYEELYAELLQGLPHRQRQTFLLLREMRYKRKSAAKVLRISENAIKFNMRKALEKLKDQVRHSTLE